MHNPFPDTLRFRSLATFVADSSGMEGDEIGAKGFHRRERIAQSPRQKKRKKKEILFSLAWSSYFLERLLEGERKRETILPCSDHSSFSSSSFLLNFLFCLYRLLGLESLLGLGRWLPALHRRSNPPLLLANRYIKKMALGRERERESWPSVIFVRDGIPQHTK